jgi:predicted acylesterase/phospholipase RssA
MHERTTTTFRCASPGQRVAELWEDHRVLAGGVTPKRVSLASCFGGGVAFGIAFDMGVAHALRDSGVPLDTGPMLGTSAGAWTAGALALGFSFPDLIAAVPADLSMRPTARRPVDVARAVYGTARDSRVEAVVLELAAPPRRRVLSGASHSIADIVAASSSLIGLVTPHCIGTRRFLDPGPFFMTSADRAPAADVLVVVAPIAGRVLGARGAVIERQLRIEMELWRRRAHGHVLYIRPNTEVTRLAGRKISDLFDVGRAHAIYDAAYNEGLLCARRFQLRHPALAAAIHSPAAAVPS